MKNIYNIGSVPAENNYIITHVARFSRLRPDWIDSMTRNPKLAIKTVTRPEDTIYDNPNTSSISLIPKAHMLPRRTKTKVQQKGREPH